MTESKNKASNAKTRVGQVVSRKMSKTAIVVVERTVKHPFYHKLVRKQTKLKMHDPKDETQSGDTVLMIETRPISSQKHWRLVKILKKAVKVEEAQV
jgi:small subunit ribosomal protein S17